jgi:competence protein ComFC
MPFIAGKQKHSFDYGSIDTIPNEIIEKKYTRGINQNFNKINRVKKDGESCKSCSEYGYNFYRLRSFGLYGGILKKLIIKFKYGKIHTLAPILSGFLKKAYLENYLNDEINYIETVPDFAAFNGRTAGAASFPDNHMQILVKIFSRETGIPYSDNIIKIKKTLRQQNLGMYERTLNLEDAFKVVNVLKAVKKNILLIDDVWTTGNTLNEISKVLKNCGAQKIYLLTIARSI